MLTPVRLGLSASRQNNLCAKVRDDETSSPTRETRALPERCSDDLPTDFVLGKLPSTAGYQPALPIASTAGAKEFHEILRVLRMLRG